MFSNNGRMCRYIYIYIKTPVRDYSTMSALNLWSIWCFKPLFYLYITLMYFSITWGQQINVNNNLSSWCGGFILKQLPVIYHDYFLLNKEILFTFIWGKSSVVKALPLVLTHQKLYHERKLKELTVWMNDMLYHASGCCLLHQTRNYTQHSC